MFLFYLSNLYSILLLLHQNSIIFEEEKLIDVTNRMKWNGLEWNESGWKKKTTQSPILKIGKEKTQKKDHVHKLPASDTLNILLNANFLLKIGRMLAIKLHKSKTNSIPLNQILFLFFRYLLLDCRIWRVRKKGWRRTN